jgi:hypothetical protein
MVATHTIPMGILVLGYNRPYHLQSVLESLRQQDRLGKTHVWIDGTQGRGEFAGANEETAVLPDAILCANCDCTART